jgi:putative ABC transport system permease protein
LRKRLGTTTLAVVALALGIGLTTTMFSIVNGAILRGLPFADSDRLLGVARIQQAEPDNTQPVTFDDFLDWRERQKVFSGLALFQNGPVIVSGVDGAERYRSASVTTNLLALLRVAPERGRDFVAADERPGAARVALISHRIWETQFKSDPAVVGRTLRINGQPTEVIGVMPAGFAFPETEDVWLPLGPARSVKRGEIGTGDVFGRLNEGITPAQATAAMQAIGAQLAAEFPENKNFGVRVTPLVQMFIGRNVISTLYTMLGAVFGVLLIACANVTNLQLARAIERGREIAIRSALGGERLRIIRQLVLEGLLLSVAGALVGLAIAQIGVTLFNAGIAGTNPPFWIDVRIDGRVLAFVSAITVASALLSSVLPAFRATRAGANDVLKDQARGTTSLRAGVLTRLLVGGSVMLSSALLIVSGLMIKSVIEVGNARYAFATADVLVARMALDDVTYQADPAILALLDRLDARLRTVGGVRSIGVASAEPMGGPSYYMTKEGLTLAKPEDAPTVRRVAATPGMFEVLKLTAIDGRLFGPSDFASSLPVAVITKDAAEKYFAGERPIGKRIRLGLKPRVPWWTIVGVIPSLSSATATDERNPATVYVPMSQWPDRNLTLLAATTGDPMAAAPGVRRAVKDVDPDLATFQVNSMDGRLYLQAWPFRVFGSLFFAFGISALLMAVAGLYGVLAFTVRLRTAEIGVRMALGADGGRIARMVLRQGMTVVGIGLAIGVTLGALASPLMSELFFNVTARDPFVYSVTITLLLATGVIASLVPARRASRVDPLNALRES